MPRSDQGVFNDRYKVIPRCLIFVENESNEILLLKGDPNKRLWANKFNGIGGHIEVGEDIFFAAKRELFEETGLKNVNLWFCGNIMIDAGEDIGITIFVFRGIYRGGEIIKSDEGEVNWIPKNKLCKHPLVEDLFTLLPKVLQIHRGDHPFAAIYTYDESDNLEINFGSLDYPPL